MHKFVFFDNKIRVAAEANLSVVSSAALYGKGVFTTVAIKDRKAFLWEKHWRRLNENAKKIGVDLSDFSENLLIESFNKLIEKNGIENGRARITFFDESASRLWNFETEKTTGVLITTADERNLPEVFRLTVSPFPVNSASPLANVKSCNYLENILALEEAKRRGFDEAVRLNEKGKIVSAVAANIFWIKDEKIFTPALETGCLAGTTREFLQEKLPVLEKNAGRDELAEADEIFLTSAGIGIRPAHFENAKEIYFSRVRQLKKILDL